MVCTQNYFQHTNNLDIRSYGVVRALRIFSLACDSTRQVSSVPLNYVLTKTLLITWFNFGPYLSFCFWENVIDIAETDMLLDIVTETFPEFFQTSEIKLFARTVFAKSSIFDVWQGSKGLWSRESNLLICQLL